VRDFAVSFKREELGRIIFTSFEVVLMLASFVVTDVIALSSELERSNASTTSAICFIEPLKSIGSEVIEAVAVSLEATGLTCTGVNVVAPLDETTVTVSAGLELLAVEVSELRTVDESMELAGLISTRTQLAVHTSSALEVVPFKSMLNALPVPIGHVKSL
jgi:hypothetical protein